MINPLINDESIGQEALIRYPKYCSLHKREACFFSTCSSGQTGSTPLSYPGIQAGMLALAFSPYTGLTAQDIM